MRKLLLIVLMTGLLFAGLHAAIAWRLDRPLATARPAATDRLYFAYGSNMSVRYLQHARGVVPVRSEAGALANHAVRFLASDLNGLEPAFAYLVPAHGEQAHGVLHRVSVRDLARIRHSEGERYVWATVRVQRADGTRVSAQTLLRDTPGVPALPSQRYLQWLIEGAAGQGLPAAYVAWLRQLHGVHVPVISTIMGDLLQASVMRDVWLCELRGTC